MYFLGSWAGFSTSFRFFFVLGFRCIMQFLIYDIALTVSPGSSENSLDLVDGAGLTRMDAGLSPVEISKEVLILPLPSIQLCQTVTRPALCVYIAPLQSIVVREFSIPRATLWSLVIPLWKFVQLCSRPWTTCSCEVVTYFCFFFQTSFINKAAKCYPLSLMI